MQNAFSAGPLQFSLPAISAGEPLVGILLGVLVFGDRIQITPGLLAIQAGGIAALIAGVVMVGRAPALSRCAPGRKPASRTPRCATCPASVLNAPATAPTRTSPPTAGRPESGDTARDTGDLADGGPAPRAEDEPVPGQSPNGHQGIAQAANVKPAID